MTLVKMHPYYLRKCQTIYDSNSKCLSLWASCRMAYDLIAAEKAGADVANDSSLVKRTKLFGTSPEDFSLDTVKGFYNDAKKAGFKI